MSTRKSLLVMTFSLISAGFGWENNKYTKKYLQLDFIEV